MAKAGALSVRQLPAPYLLNTESLLAQSKQPNVQTVFYRGGDASMAMPPVDSFAVGHFKENSFSWPDRDTAFDWAEALERLTDVLNLPVSIAGYLSYEAGFAFERKWQLLRRPLSGYVWWFFEIPCWYEANHQTRTAAYFTVDSCKDAELEFLMQTVSAAGDNVTAHNIHHSKPLRVEQLEELGELSYNDYASAVRQILEDIAAGRYYELNFTQRFCLNTTVEPTEAFIGLFVRYAPRRAFYAKFLDEIIGSCSPELFLKKEGERVFTRPIKGSFTNSPENAKLDKLTAEHTMVVDLARNDVGRISNLEWVQVPELSTASSFGGLQHLESLVTGKTSYDLRGILPHTFPAASITGAPKVEVVQAISEYEISPRGLYTGTCGWVRPDGNCDLNVAIRSFVATQASATSWNYTLGAGGAIVADSDPEQEYRECLGKVLPLLSELLPVNKSSST